MADLTCNIKIRDNSGPIWDTYLYILYGNTTMVIYHLVKYVWEIFLWEPKGNHKKKRRTSSHSTQKTSDIARELKKNENRRHICILLFLRKQAVKFVLWTTNYWAYNLAPHNNLQCPSVAEDHFVKLYNNIPTLWK